MKYILLFTTLVILPHPKWQKNVIKTVNRCTEKLRIPHKYYSYDSVFIAKVIVPIRKCSIGYCAGLKVIKNVKSTGNLDKALIKISSSANLNCMPRLFSSKGAIWKVYGNQGTTPQKGYRYVEVSTNSPTKLTTINTRISKR